MKKLLLITLVSCGLVQAGQDDSNKDSDVRNILEYCKKRIKSIKNAKDNSNCYQVPRPEAINYGPARTSVNSGTKE